MPEIKIFDRWSMEGIKVEDLGLQPYVTLAPRIVPKTGARYAGSKFHKSKKHFKTSGHITGKAHTSFDIVEETFRHIEKATKENPVKVFVKALENAAQREEIITIEYGGARYPKAVECSPQRRVDLALRHMTQGAYHRTFNTKKSIVNSLAEEIMSAYRLSSASNAISKKLEIERQADSSR